MNCARPSSTRISPATSSFSSPYASPDRNSFLLITVCVTRGWGVSSFRHSDLPTCNSGVNSFVCRFPVRFRSNSFIYRFLAPSEVEGYAFRPGLGGSTFSFRSSDLPTFRLSDLPTCNSFVFFELPPLCPLFAAFSALVSFIFSILQPLFADQGGGGH